MILEPAGVIIIRGAPGVGKSEAARGLARHFPGGTRIEVDNLRSMINSVRWTDQQEHKNLLQVAARLTGDLLALGFIPAIVVDSFSGDKVDAYLDTLRQLNPAVGVWLFGLYATEAALQSRLEGRRDDQFKDFAIARKINADLSRFRHLDEVQIDTSILTQHEVVETILRLLEASDSGGLASLRRQG